MKKALITMAVLAVAGIMASCQKDGAYSPKNKISKVYYEYDSLVDGVSSHTDKHLTEVWNWTDDKLDSINHMYADGTDISYVESYTYDGKHISLVEQHYPGYTEPFSKTVFTYDGNKLTQVENFSGSYLTSTYTFTHKAGKISQIDVTYPSGSNYDYKSVPTVVRMMTAEVMPEEMMNKAFSRAKASTTRTLSIKLSYLGSNVSKVDYSTIYTTVDNGMETVETRTTTTKYEYDGKSNPYYEMMGGLSPIYLSKNNVKKETYTSSESVTEDGELVEETNYLKEHVTEYTYTYDGSKPTMQSGKRTEVMGNRTDTYTKTYYYEY